MDHSKIPDSSISRPVARGGTGKCKFETRVPTSGTYANSAADLALVGLDSIMYFGLYLLTSDFALGTPKTVTGPWT